MKNVLFLLLVSFLISCKQNPKNSIDEKNPVADTTSPFVEEPPTKVVDTTARVELRKEFESLKKKFIINHDDFQNTTWYTHKQWGKYWPNRCTIVVKVRGNGTYYVESNYWDSDDWCFHENVIVSAANQVLRSPKVETYSEEHLSDNEPYNLWEVNQYLKGDNGIAEFIKSNADGPVKVRFEGKRNIKDVTLSSNDKKAIVESLRIAELLASLQ